MNLKLRLLPPCPVQGRSQGWGFWLLLTGQVSPPLPLNFQVFLRSREVGPPTPPTPGKPIHFTSFLSKKLRTSTAESPQKKLRPILHHGYHQSTVIILLFTKFPNHWEQAILSNAPANCKTRKPPLNCIPILLPAACGHLLPQNYSNHNCLQTS